jgi:hypothetical protein
MLELPLGSSKPSDPDHSWPPVSASNGCEASDEVVECKVRNDLWR